MIISKTQQQTPEWLEERKGKVTGTTAGGLFIASDTLLIELLVSATGDELPEVYVNSAMERGTELEPEARIELEAYTGFKFNEVGFCTHDEIKLLGISPDGITDSGTVMCEIKCPEAKKHIATCLDGKIPKDNQDQCLHYFTVNEKLETLYFMSFRPENKLKPIFVTTWTQQTLVKRGQMTKSVGDWAHDARAYAQTLEVKLQETLEKLKF